MNKKIQSLADFLARLKGVKKMRDGYAALCPAHTDHDQSLSVKQTDGKILVYCHAGCQVQDILEVLGLEMIDLFLGENQRDSNQRKQGKQKPGNRKIAAVYHYTDAEGRPFEVVRMVPKAFCQRRPNKEGTGYIYNLKGIKPTLYHQDELPEAIADGKTIYNPEGEKDVDRLRGLGLVSTTNPMGAGKWRDSYSETLEGADLVIIPDADDAGRRHAQQVAESCYGKAARVRILELPAKDVSDWLDEGGDISQLEELASQCPEYMPSDTTRNQELPVVVCSNRQLRDKTGDTLHVVYERNKAEPEIFQRGGNLVRVNLDEKHNPYIELLAGDALRGILTRVADFINIRADAKGGTVTTSVSPPLDVVNDILSLKNWEFPSLLAITSTPVIRNDGSILTKPGYDAATGLYYYSHLSLPDIPANPTDDDVEVAVAQIKEVLWDFPFNSIASRANAVASLITPVIRPLIDGIAPLAVFDKPQPGTGASLLCDVIALIATGKPAGMTGGFKDDTEWRKNITTTLLRGHAIVTIDNVDGNLYSPSLATLLTSLVWRDRILGRNEEVLLPNVASWLANGNNIKLEGDLPRRAYWIRLDAQEAEPWLRSEGTFRHPHLISWVKEHRGDILAAILTLARAWVLAGRPTPQKSTTIGSYENWCLTLGGILDYAGIDGFLTNLQEMYSITDPETPAWEVYLEIWQQTFGDNPVTVSEITKTAKDDLTFAYYIPDSLGSVEDKGFSRKLGKALSKRLGMRFRNGFAIQKGEEKRHAVSWRIVKAEETKLTDFSFGGEFREFVTTVSEKNFNNNNDDEKINRELGETNSRNSHLATKSCEFSLADRLIEFWGSLGRPLIHLGPGENCEDLAKLLSNPNISPRHLEAVKNWAVENGWHSPEEGADLPDI